MLPCRMSRTLDSCRFSRFQRYSLATAFDIIVVYEHRRWLLLLLLLIHYTALAAPPTRHAKSTFM